MDKLSAAARAMHELSTGIYEIAVKAVSGALAGTVELD
jgi:hypothetical protein